MTMLDIPKDPILPILPNVTIISKSAGRKLCSLEAMTYSLTTSSTSTSDPFGGSRSVQASKFRLSLPAAELSIETSIIDIAKLATQMT